MARAYNQMQMAKAASGKGRLSRIERRIDRLDKFAANLIGGEGISILPNARGGATIRRLGFDSGGGLPSDDAGAFRITATELLQPGGASYSPKRYNVHIRGGTAQALGQAPVNYDSALFEDVVSPLFFFIKYNMTTYAWIADIQSSLTIPTGDDPYPIVLGALDALGARQDRLGGVEVVVTDNSVDANE